MLLAAVTIFFLLAMVWIEFLIFFSLYKPEKNERESMHIAFVWFLMLRMNVPQSMSGSHGLKKQKKERIVRGRSMCHVSQDTNGSESEFQRCMYTCAWSGYYDCYYNY